MSPYLWVVIVIGALLLVGLAIGLGVWGGKRKKNQAPSRPPPPAGETAYYIESAGIGENLTKSCYFVFNNYIKKQTAAAPDSSGEGWRETPAPPATMDPQEWEYNETLSVPNWAGTSIIYTFTEGMINGEPERTIPYYQGEVRRWMRVGEGSCKAAGV